MYPCGSLWIPVDPFGSLWIPLDPFGSLWLSLNFFGSGWIPLDPFGSLWIPFDSFGLCLYTCTAPICQRGEIISVGLIQNQSNCLLYYYNW